MPNLWLKVETRGNIHNTSVFMKLINEPDKLERYITHGWKDLPGTNGLMLQLIWPICELPKMK